MKKLIILLLFGFVVYLKPPLTLPDGDTILKAEKVYIGSTGFTRIETKDGKSYSIPTANILYIVGTKP